MGQNQKDSGSFSDFFTNPDRFGRFITTVGVPSVIALFLVYQLAGAIGTAQREDHAAILNAIHAGNEAIMMGNREHDALGFYLRALCLNAATDATELQRCDIDRNQR